MEGAGKEGGGKSQIKEKRLLGQKIRKERERREWKEKGKEKKGEEEKGKIKDKRKAPGRVKISNEWKTCVSMSGSVKHISPLFAHYKWDFLRRYMVTLKTQPLDAPADQQIPLGRASSHIVNVFSDAYE